MKSLNLKRIANLEAMVNNMKDVYCVVERSGKYDVISIEGAKQLQFPVLAIGLMKQCLSIKKNLNELVKKNLL